MMTKEQFDDFIKETHNISRKFYEDNKDFFDEAKRQGKISIDFDSSIQVTDGNIVHPSFERYQVKPINR